MKLSSSEKCCGIERISLGLSCCNGVGYNSMLQVCADISSTHSGEKFYPVSVLGEQLNFILKFPSMSQRDI